MSGKNLDIDSTNWITTREAAKLLKRSERIVQAWGKEGKLKRRPHPDHPRTFAYNRAEVEKIAEITQTVLRATHAPSPQPETAVAVRAPKPTQTERALDTVSIVGNLVAGHKAEMEMLARNLETVATQAAKSLESVVELILKAQKAEADANRERLKAEREDARERWEMDRQDRLERRKARADAPQLVNGKTRKTPA